MAALPRRMFTYACAVVVLAVIGWDIRHRTFRQVMDGARRWRRRWYGGWLDSGRAGQVATTLARYWPGSCNCLHQSLTAFWILKASGCPGAKVVVAVRKIPFGAHSWVEVGGQPIISTTTDGVPYQPMVEVI